ncbi:MAG: reverse transcriptase family protein [Agriterribacter sp.]
MVFCYNASLLYRNIQKPKIKFGRPQRDNAGNIRYRHLSIPKFELKCIQKKIVKGYSSFEFPDFMFGSIRGKNHIRNAFYHKEGNYFLNIDMKKFFPNISHKQVYDSLTRHLLKPDVARLVTKLTTVDGKLPQGSPSSPFLANLVFLPTVIILNRYVLEHSLSFSCYVDDLTFSSKTNFKHLVPSIVDVIRKAGFYPANNKIGYAKNKMEITGILIDGKRIDLIPDMKKKAKQNRNVMRYYDHVREEVVRLRIGLQTTGG